MHEFSVRVEVIVTICLERFPFENIYIHARCTGPYAVLDGDCSYAYGLDIPRDLHITRSLMARIRFNTMF